MRRIKAILVHGTFAAQTDWDDPDGAFAQMLKERIAEKGDALDVEEFRWSGENSHEARRIAAETLAEKLQTDGRGGYDELFLVGHSHGGTVTRLAVNKLDSDERPTGVFTLGAPFVRFKPKPLSLAATVITVLLRVLALIGVAMIARIFYVQDWIRAWIDESTGMAMLHEGATALLGLFLAWFLVLFCPSRLKGWVLGSLSRTQEELIRSYDPPAKQDTPFICYHALLDEAGLLLRFWSIITWVLQTGVFIMVYGAILLLLIAIPMLAYQAAVGFGLIEAPMTQGLFAWFIQAGREIVETLFGFSINDPVEIPAETAALQVPSAAVFSTLAIFGFLVISALLSTPLTLLAPWLFRRQWFAFGGEKLAWNLAADIQVDRRANDLSKMRYVFLPGAYLRGEIQHNYYYLSNTVTRDIARRMASWTPPARRRSVDLERGFGNLLTVVLLVVVVASAVPFTWAFAELMTEPPIVRRDAPEAGASGDAGG